MWKTINGKKVNIGANNHKSSGKDKRFEVKKKPAESQKSHHDSFESVRNYFNSLNSMEQFMMEDDAGVKPEDQLYNSDDHHNFDDNLESTQKKLSAYYSKFIKNNPEKSGGLKSYPESVTIDDFDDVFGKDILMYVDEESHSDEPNSNSEHIEEDPVKRKQFALEYAKKHGGQIYTYVDLDSGDAGYSKGMRFVNRINQGEYVIVKTPGLKVDNS